MLTVLIILAALGYGTIVYSWCVAAGKADNHMNSIHIPKDEIAVTEV